jgi:hypothetical protein
MIMLLSDTLFHHWAKQFVHLAIKHTPDEVIWKLTEREGEYPLGRYGERDFGEYDIRINFGSTIDKAAKVQDIMSIVQMLMQNQRANPAVLDELIKQIITLKLGENTNVSNVFEEHSSLLPQEDMENPNEQQEPPQEEQLDPNEEREKALMAMGAI